MGDIDLRKKFTFKIHGKKIVLIKKSYESFAHVAAKALCYALYLSFYSDIKVEVKIGERYKPDLVMLGDDRKPVFWAECGAVSRQKIYKILHKFPATHFSFIKIAEDIGQFKKLIIEQKEKAGHTGHVDIIGFSEGIIEDLSDEVLSRVKLKDHLVIRL